MIKTILIVAAGTALGLYVLNRLTGTTNTGTGTNLGAWSIGPESFTP